MSHIYINNPELPDGFHYRHTVDLTEPTYSDDTFQVLRSDEPHYPLPFFPFLKCWTWTAWSKGKRILSIVGDEHQMPDDILSRAKQICYGEIELPLPKSAIEDSHVVDYQTNRVVSAKEYALEQARRRSNMNIINHNKARAENQN